MRDRRWTPYLLGFVVYFALLCPTSADDPFKDLKSRDVATRLKAIEQVRKAGGENAEKILVTALKDDDWEVVERAAEALAEHGAEKSIKALSDVAASGRVRRVRLQAARSLARLNREEAAKRLTKRLRKNGVAVAEALAILTNAVDEPAEKELLKGVTRALKSSEAPVRSAAAHALRALPEDERIARVEALLDDGELTVVASTLDALRNMPALRYFPAIAKRFAYPNVNDVIARRLIATIESIFAMLQDDERAEATRLLTALVASVSDDASGSARAARLLGNLASVPAPIAAVDKPDDDADATLPVAPNLPVAEALGMLAGLLTHTDEGARAEAVRSLRRIGTTEAIDRAEKALTDKHPRVRFQALEAIVAGRGLDNAPTLELVAKRLADDDDATVREQAAILLGRSGPEGAPFAAPVKALAAALKDKVWSVAVVAAVSLGKTRSEDAVAPLLTLLGKKVKDWRLRGAAVVGLGKLQQKKAVTPLIGALKEKDSWVRRNAYEFLRRLTKRKISDSHAEWTAWWKFNEATYEFEDREKIARELKRGGYAVDPVKVYDKGASALDVVVLQSRGDHIEDLLEELGVEYRLTRAAQVEKADVHSFAIFVANCTGEIQKNDIERLQWFVRTGGFLFCSCWALHHTVEKVYPGLVRKLPTRGEVLDNVVSMPCPSNSPFLDDVFRPWSQPIYVLFGSHLIDVMQPERVEVLIDSPQAAARWGGGNMAAWFPAGHGVILDSANHFDLQGLERVNGLKSAEDRMAYAMNHMGLDYPELRKFAADGIWKKQAQATKLVRDLSAFRFLTNFVRLKRKTDP